MRLTPSLTLTTLGLLATLPLLTHCSHLTRPSPEHALLDESTVVDAVDHTTSRGSMLLMEDGLWALIEPKLSPKKGEVLVLTQHEREDAPLQLFAVISVHDWGVTLQRISRTSFTPTEHYILTPIAPEALTFAQHGAQVCLDEESCKTKPYQHLAYPLTGKDLRLEPAHSPHADRYTLPLKPVWRRAAVPHLLIATDAGHSPGFIALIDAACPNTLVDLLPDSVERVVRPLTEEDRALSHPLWVEKLATAHLVDVIVSCPTRESVQIATPSLGRPWLPSRQELKPSPGPALLTASPLVFDVAKTSPEQLALIVQGAGHIARGFPSLAAVYFEQVFARDEFSRQRDAIALPLAQVIALDAPEQALHIAHQATRQAWRRDEVLAHNFVLITIWNALSQQTPILKIENALPERAQRQSESPIAEWATWRGLTQMIREDDLRTWKEALSASKSFQNNDETRPSWHAMVALSLLLDATPPVDGSYQELLNALSVQGKALGVEPMILHYTTTDHGTAGCDLTTPSSPCLADVYGKRLKSVWERPALLDVLLGVPALPPTMTQQSWKYAPESDEPLIDLAIQLINAYQPPHPIEVLAARQARVAHTGKAPTSEEIAKLRAYSTHRDRAAIEAVTEVDALLETMEVWRAEHPGVTTSAQFASQISGAGKTHLSLIYTYWYHALLSDFGVPDLTERLDVLRKHLPGSARAEECVGIHAITALSFLQDNRTAQAEEAFRAVRACDMEALGAERRLEIEVVRAMIIRQDQGSLPGKQSGAFQDKLATLPVQATAFCDAAFERPQVLSTLLGDEMRRAAQHFEPVSDAARAPGGEAKMSLTPLNAYSWHAMARGALARADTQLQAQESDAALATLEEARAAAKKAHAPWLMRRAEFILGVLNMPVTTGPKKSAPLVAWLVQDEMRRRGAPAESGGDMLTPGQRAQLELALAMLSQDEPAVRARLEDAKIDRALASIRTLCTSEP